MFLFNASFCTWSWRAAHLQDALLVQSAFWGISQWLRSIYMFRSTQWSEFLGWSVPTLCPRSSVHHHQMEHSWTEMSCSPPGLGQTDLGQTALGSGRSLPSRGCHGCCTSHSSLGESGIPARDHSMYCQINRVSTEEPYWLTVCYDFKKNDERLNTHNSTLFNTNCKKKNPIYLFDSNSCFVGFFDNIKTYITTITLTLVKVTHVSVVLQRSFNLTYFK